LKAQRQGWFRAAGLSGTFTGRLEVHGQGDVRQRAGLHGRDIARIEPPGFIGQVGGFLVAAQVPQQRPHLQAIIHHDGNPFGGTIGAFVGGTIFAGFVGAGVVTFLHLKNHIVADSLRLQPGNVFGRQGVFGVCRSDLIDDDSVTDVILGHLNDIGKREWRIGVCPFLCLGKVFGRVREKDIHQFVVVGSPGGVRGLGRLRTWTLPPANPGRHEHCQQERRQPAKSNHILPP
jgi:hypothetical protein